MGHAPQLSARKRLKRLLWIVLCGAVLIAGTAAYIALHFDLPEGTGPAGPAVPAEPFEQPWTARKVLLLGVGDSVTAGLGSTRGRSYFERLGGHPADDFDDVPGRCPTRGLPGLTTCNTAVSGSNSLQHVQWVRDKLEKQPDDVFGLVVMTSGGNDLIHWYGRSPPHEGAMYGATLEQARPWIANYEKRLDEMFALLEA